MGKTSSEPRASARAAKQRTPAPAKPRSKRLRVAVVTGTRAEFGLLCPVMDAIKARKDLQLLVVAGGAHLLPPARTIREVESAYTVAATVPMQRPGQTGRAADAAALGRGVSGFANAFADLKPDWVVVLGDRIEALAAASAASVAGIAVCHIHGGDRAEGIADEAMRHAITKLSHLHCAATKLSANRVVKMGEKADHVHVTGSPAIDGIDAIATLDDTTYQRIKSPRAVVLLHPWGGSAKTTRKVVEDIALICFFVLDARVLWLPPNHDPGRDDILKPLLRANLIEDPASTPHMSRGPFLALLKRLATSKPRGVLIGNSSAGIIEASALGLTAINIGPRQAGRERARNVIDAGGLEDDELDSRIGRAVERGMRWRTPPSALYGDGRAGPRIAALLAQTDPHAPALLRKRNAY